MGGGGDPKGGETFFQLILTTLIIRQISEKFDIIHSYLAEISHILECVVRGCPQKG